MKKLLAIFTIIISILLFLTACDLFGGGDETSTAPQGGETFGEVRLGQSFEFNNLEITLSDNIGFTKMVDEFLLSDEAYVFYLPITFTNIGDTSAGLNQLLVNIFSPDGMNVSHSRGALEVLWMFEETSVFSVGSVRPGVTVERNLYILYAEDGEYVIEFINFYDDVLGSLSFTVEFDFDAVPERGNDFALGDTFEFDGMEFTINEIASWGTVQDEWSNNFGEHYFSLPVTMRNVSNEAKGFPWNTGFFGPNGHELTDISRSASEEDIRNRGNILPGAVMSGYLHIQYVEAGEYVIRFNTWNRDDLTVRIQVARESGGEAVTTLPEPPAEPPVSLPESPTAQRMTSDEMRRFEAANAVTPEQERYLAFGPFVLVGNNESIRVFALGESGLHATRLLRDWWSVEDRESALEQVERLATATGQSPIADEIFREFVLTGNYTEHLDGLGLFIVGFDITRFENLYNNAVSRAERMGDEALDSLLEALEADGFDLSREEAFELLVYFQFAERVNNGLDAFVGAGDLLIKALGFTERELLNIPTLAAWDYGRTAIIARYGVAAGFLEEDEAWEYLKLAADSASETYSSWREFTAAHVLGRALAFGNSSEEWRDMLNFLLNHPESSFQTIDFKVD